MKKLLSLLTMMIVAITSSWAADLTYVLTSFTQATTDAVTTYTYEFSETKLKNYEKIYVEVPSATASGTASWKGSSANSSRFLYIYKTNGTVKDETRKIEFKKAYESVSYTSEDIATVGGKYYLVFGTTDDYKAVGVKFTVPAATEKYTVTFEAGEDGTCATTSLEEETAGAGVTLPEVTGVTEGMAFMGWYTAASEGTLAGAAGATYNPTANITLYAQYQAIAPYDAPTITEINGTVQIASTQSVDGMKFKYSIDGGTTYSDYTIPFNLSEAKTVKAYVTGTSAAYTDSEVATQECSAIPTAAAGSTSITLYYNTSDMSKGSSKPYPLTGKTGTDYEGWAITIDNTSKELGSGNDIISKKSLKGSNGVQVQITMPDNVTANRVTIYSYNNSDLTGTSLWSEVAGTAYTEDTEIGLKSRSAEAPDVRVFTLNDVTGTLTFNNNGQAQQCFVAVVDYTTPAVAVTGVTVDETAQVAVGGTVTLTATIAPANATNKNVSWESDDTSVATVDATTGVVTGVAEGTANITVTTEDGSFTDVCVVTVVPIEGSEIIKATLTSNTAATVTGTVGGEADVKVATTKDASDGYKFGGKDQYIGLTLATGYTFQTGDIINVHTTTTARQGTIAIYDANKSTILYDTEVYTTSGTAGELENIDNIFALPAEVNGKSTIYVCRTADNNWNGYVDYISVTRPNKTITLNASGYATYSYDKDFAFAGAKAYKMALNEDAGTIAGTEVTGVIPAGEGILFKGTAGATVAITETAEEAPVITGNDLKGSTDGNGDLVAKPTYCYVLKGDTFKKFTGTALTANKAFFAASSDLAPQSFEITFEGEATAVEAVAETNAEAVAPVKVIKNGKLYIGNYNVAGQQVK